MKNKKVKQSICDALNHKENRTKRSLFMWVWMEQDSSPCRICFRTCNFMWQKSGEASLTADQLKKVK